MSEQTLKEFFIPPFRNGGYCIEDSNKTLFEVREGFSGNWKDLLEFAAAALNEKYQRDFGEPLRWELLADEFGEYWRCPKCKMGNAIYSNSYNYCPICGTKLDPPETIHLVSETIDGVKTGLIIPEDRIIDLAKGEKA